MPEIAYIDKNFRLETRQVIEQARRICREYHSQGFDLTLRQLYYQFVAHDLFDDARTWRQTGSGKWVRDPNGTKNAEPNYKYLGDVISDARLAGLLDWNYIVDRTRSPLGGTGWMTDPAQVIEPGVYSIDKWDDQEHHVECFPPGTSVTMVDGVKAIENVKVGEYVLTHAGRYRRVEAVVCQSYEGDLMEVRAVGLLPVRMTPEHPVFAAPYNDDLPGYTGARRRHRPEGFVPAGSLKPFDLLTLPRIIGSSAPPRLTLEGSIRSRAVTVNVESSAKALGLYVAEGSVRADNRTTQFALGSTETAQARHLVEWAEACGLRSQIALGRGTRIVYVYGARLARWLAVEFGSGAYNKTVPRWAMTLPVGPQMALACSWFEGDGTWRLGEGAMTATSRSRSLTQQMQLILARNGYGSSLAMTVDHGAPRYGLTIAGGFARQVAPEWGIDFPETMRSYNHVRLEPTATQHPVRSVKRVDYRGLVYNLQVEQDESYCVPMAVHNCWIEKEALAGVLQRACPEFEIVHFSCRGYVSQSAMWSAAQRLSREIQDGGKQVRIIHLGDHDPSGIDMTRDIEERLGTFIAQDLGYCDSDDDAQTCVAEIWPDFEVNRIALNMDQVRRYNPPPNPAKLSDSRGSGYVDRFGPSSWELDALDPATLVGLIRSEVEGLRDREKWDAKVAQEQAERKILTATKAHWPDVEKFVRGEWPEEVE